MLKYCLIVFFVSVVYLLRGQEISGNINIIQDPRLDTLLLLHKDLNVKSPRIDGWRVNIFFETGNNSKKLAMEAKAGFVQKYPNVPSYLVFQEPYYKIRVGDYRTRLEAEKFLKIIAAEYPNAFVVEDKINFPELDYRYY